MKIEAERVGRCDEEQGIRVGHNSQLEMRMRTCFDGMVMEREESAAERE